MITLTINKQKVSVPEGSTILGAARQVDIDIPTMCYLEGLPHNTSCMICVVEEMENGRLLPSCSAPAADGMVVETDNDRVREFRKDTLDLLLSEHVGDCDAPCTRTCPAYMDIPLMIRQIQQQDWEGAIKTVKADIPLPAVLGRICPAPCEKGCTRSHHDGALSICLLKRIVADIDLEQDSPYMPECAPATGRTVAIVGAGPAGLSAAYYIRQFGHDCTIYDRNEKAGGTLRYGIDDEKLPKSVLDDEIKQIERLGVKFEFNRALGGDISIAELKSNYDAVILTTGEIDTLLYQNSGLESRPKGLVVDRKTLATPIEGVFAGGSLVSQSRMAVRSVGHGKIMALSAHQFLSRKPVVGRVHRFNSIMGRIQSIEAEEYLKEASASPRQEPAAGTSQGFTVDESVAEALRCFHCDCRKQHNCKLRDYSDLYGASQSRFKTAQRKPLEKQVQHDLVAFEPGKCIKCGLCIQIAEKNAEKFGLTFINRGFNVKIAIPFNEALDKGLAKVARECAEACPTAAIALK